MKSLYLNTATKDLEMDNLKRFKMIEGEAEDRQAIWLELSTEQGEWCFNTEYGLPWWELLDQNASIEVIRAEVIKALYRVNRISKLTKLEIDFDRSTRKLTIDFEGIRLDGSTTNQVLMLGGG